MMMFGLIIKRIPLIIFLLSFLWSCNNHRKEGFCLDVCKVNISDTLVYFSDSFGVHFQCDYQLSRKGFIKVSDSSKIWIEFEGKGNPLLLIQGGPLFDHRYFHPHFSELSINNTLIYTDLRGRYMSSESENIKYNLLQDIEDLEEIRVKLGIKQWSILGHSFGGYIALLYSILYPESINTTILVSTPLGIAQSQYDSLASTLLNSIFKNVNTKEENIEAQLNLNFSKKPSENNITYLRKTLNSYNNYSKFNELNSNYLANSLNTWRSYLGKDFLEIDNSILLKTPLHVISSKMDKVGFWKETNYFMTKKRSKSESEIHIFYNSSHFPWIEEKEKFFELIINILPKD
jgi:proline iminopeptidase